MGDPSYPLTRHDYGSDAEELERLEHAAGEAPKGALVISAISVVLLMIGWFFAYLVIFLPRGTVG
jgi:hypothetical protein